MSVTHSPPPPQTAALVHLCCFWFEKLGFQTLPSQAPLTLQPTLLLPTGRHPTVLPKPAFRQHCSQEISYSPKAWLWLGFEEWKHAISIPTQQGKYIGHRETRKLSPPTIMVAGSHLKHRSMEGSLGAFWNFIKRCICSYFVLTKVRKSFAEGLLHNPHKKQQHVSITAESCWWRPAICSPKTTHSCRLETQHTCSLLQELAKQKGFGFYYYYFSTRHKPLCWETQTNTSCRQRH